MIERGPWRFESEEALDEAIQQRGATGFEAMLDTCELIRWADELQRWAKTGHSSLSEYLERRCRLAYRSCRRYLSVLEALDAIPEEERAASRAILIQMGSHKSSALAPWLRERGKAEGTAPPGLADLKPWAELAAEMSEEAFQEAVTDARGLPGRATGGDVNMSVLAGLLRYVPPERADWVRRVLETTMRREETNAVGAFLLAIDALANDLGAQGVEVCP